MVSHKDANAGDTEARSKAGANLMQVAGEPQGEDTVVVGGRETNDPEKPYKIGNTSRPPVSSTDIHNAITQLERVHRMSMLRACYYCITHIYHFFFGGA
jgi:hypothetical protein